MAALENLFSKSNAQFSSNNTSLRYQARSLDTLPVKNESIPTNDGPVVASVVILYRYENSKPIDLGKKGAAIVANKDHKNNSYCLICYEIKNRNLLFSITIQKNWKINVLNNNFISFYDSKSNYFALRLPNSKLLEEFVIALTMSKIPKIMSLNNNSDIIIEDLNYNEAQTEIKVELHRNYSLVCDLRIWLSNITNHPFKKGQLVFNNKKTIHLANTKKILPALSLMFNNSQKIHINGKKFIIASSNYGFGAKGNKTLSIPPNAAIMMQVTVESCIDHTDNENNDDDDEHNEHINDNNNYNNNDNNNTNNDNNNYTNNSNDDFTDNLHNNEHKRRLSPKQRMARLSASTGSSLLATLVGNNITSSAEGKQQKHHAQIPTVTLPPTQISKPDTTTIQNTVKPQMQNIAQQQQSMQNITQQTMQNIAQQQMQHIVQQPMQTIAQPTMQNIAQHSMQNTVQQQMQNILQQSMQNTVQTSLQNTIQEPMHNNNDNEIIVSKLNDIWLELNNLRNPLNKISCGDIIKCLNELNTDLSQSKTEINSQKLEIESLKEELNRLKSRNHELLEKNNRFMEEQYKSMSSSNDELLRLRKENIEYENDILKLKQNNETLESENESMKQKVNDLNTNLNECKLKSTSNEEQITQYIKECEAKQNEINDLEQNKNKLQQEITDLSTNYDLISSQLTQSKSESKEIFNQSKKRIENLKKKFEVHQMRLIKRIMSYVYIKYRENIEANENDFNYISFFRTITKQILLNPHDFDEEDDDEEEENGEEAD